MAKTKIMPGELFIVEYVNGGFENRWAINASKNYITIEPGRLAKAGVIDVLVEPEEGQDIINSRYHIVGDTSGVKFVNEVAFRDFSFAEVPLKVLKVAKETEIYSRTGEFLGTIPAGSEIGTQEADAGNSMRFLMVANCYNDGSGWKFINQQSYSYGFVNIQKGHGLQRFDDTKALVTTVSETAGPIDWATVAEVIKTTEPETTLRGDLGLLTKDQIVEKVHDFFAGIDLQKADLMDPIQYFAVPNNRSFVERELTKVDSTKAAHFSDNADLFNS